MKKIQLYGLFRTGTNYVSEILERNFFVKIHKEGNEYGLNNKGFCTNWKHGPYVGHLLHEEFPMVIVSKNPYSWLVSCYKYWQKYPLGPEIESFSFEQFVKASPCCLEGSATVPFMFRAKNLMQYYWNAYYHWTSVRSTKFFIVQYEAVLEDCEGTFNKLANFLELESREEFNNIEKNVLWNVDESNQLRIENNPIDMTATQQDFNKDYYENKEWMEMYSDDLLRYVKNEWDISIGNLLSYRTESPTCFEKLIFPQQ